MPKRRPQSHEEGERIPRCDYGNPASRSYTDTVGCTRLTGFLSFYSVGLEDSAEAENVEASRATVVALADGAEAKRGTTRGGPAIVPTAWVRPRYYDRNSHGWNSQLRL